MDKNDQRSTNEQPSQQQNTAGQKQGGLGRENSGNQSEQNETLKDAHSIGYGRSDSGLNDTAEEE